MRAGASLGLALLLKTLFENDKVRAVRFVLGPRERSPIHPHGDRVTVVLTDGKTRVTLPDGRSEEVVRKAGEVVWRTAAEHAVENLLDSPYETVSIELKNTPATP